MNVDKRRIFTVWMIIMLYHVAIWCLLLGDSSAFQPNAIVLSTYTRRMHNNARPSVGDPLFFDLNFHPKPAANWDNRARRHVDRGLPSFATSSSSSNDVSGEDTPVAIPETRTRTVETTSVNSEPPTNKNNLGTDATTGGWNQNGNVRGRRIEVAGRRVTLSNPRIQPTRRKITLPERHVSDRTVDGKRKSRQRTQRPGWFPAKNQFSPARRKTVSEFKIGSIVKGRVAQISSYGAFIDVGAVTNVLIHISKLSTSYVRNVEDVLSLGQEVDVKIVGVDHSNGQLEISLLDEDTTEVTPEHIGASRARERMTKLNAEGWDPNQFVEGIVVGVMKYGAFVRIQTGSLNSNCTGPLECLVHVSHLSPQHLGKDAQIRVKVGDKINVRLLKLDESLIQGALTTLTEEEIRSTAMLSSSLHETIPDDSEQDVSGLVEMGWDPNKFVQGTVLGVRPGGIDISVENNLLNSNCTGSIVGFVRENAIPKKRDGNTRPVCNVGDNVNVRLAKIDNTKVHLSMLPPRRKSLQDFEIGDIVRGRVREITSFGAFVDVGASSDALLHISMLSPGYTTDINEVLSVGQEVEAKVEHKGKGRLRLSMLERGSTKADRKILRKEKMRELVTMLNKEGWDTNQFVNGTVIRAMKYGVMVAFDVNLLNCNCSGSFESLVPTPYLSTEWINSGVEDSVRVGEKVPVRLLKVDESEGHGTLSMLTEDEFRAKTQWHSSQQRSTDVHFDDNGRNLSKLVELGWDTNQYVEGTIVDTRPGGIFIEVENKLLNSQITGTTVGMVPSSSTHNEDHGKSGSVFKIGERVQVRLHEIRGTKAWLRMLPPGPIENHDTNSVGPPPRAKSLSDYKLGDAVSGRVVRVVPYGVYVDIGATVDALVHISKISSDFIVDVNDVFSVGQEVHGEIVQLDPEKGTLELGKMQESGIKHTRYSVKDSMVREVVKTLNDNGWNPDQFVEGTVLAVTGVGVYVRLETSLLNSNCTGPLECYLPVPHLSAKWVQNVHDIVKKGDKVQVRLLELDTLQGRLTMLTKEELQAKETMLSSSRDDEHLGHSQQAVSELLNTGWDSNRFVEGTVLGAKPGGIMISVESELLNSNCNGTIVGFVHENAIPKEGEGLGEAALKAGEKVQVRLHEIRGRKVRLSMLTPDLLQNEQTEHDSLAQQNRNVPSVPRGKPFSEFEIGSFVKGRVEQIIPFGAFVNIGAVNNALLHVSKISLDYIPDIHQVLSVGQEVEVKIINFDSAKNQVEVTMIDELPDHGLHRSSRKKSMRDTLIEMKAEGWDPHKFVNGNVIGTTKYGVFVRFEASSLNSNFSGPLECLLHGSQLPPEHSNNVQEFLKVGDQIRVRLLNINEFQGQGDLSMLAEEELPDRTMLKSEAGQEAKEEYFGDSGQDVSGLVDMGWDPNQFVEGAVIGTRPGGIDIAVENSLLNSNCTGSIVGFVSERAIPKDGNGDGRSVLGVGDKVQVRLHDVRDTRVWLSMLPPDVLQNDQQEHHQWGGEHSKAYSSPRRKPLSELEVGSLVKGKVVQVTPFGAFVDVGAAINGLVHISKMSSDFIADIHEVLHVGQEVEARITDIDEGKRQMNLSMIEDDADQIVSKNAKKETMREAMIKLKNEGWDSKQFVDGIIVGVTKYGAFARFEASHLNSNCTGYLECLLHASQLSTEQFNVVEELVKVGDKVQIRLLDLDESQVHGELSMLTEEEAQAKAIRDSEAKQEDEEEYFGDSGQDVSGLVEMGWDPNQFVEGAVIGTRPGGIDIEVENKLLNSSCTGSIVGFVSEHATPKYSEGWSMPGVGDKVQVRLHDVRDTRVWLSMLTPDVLEKEQIEHDVQKKQKGRAPTLSYRMPLSELEVGSLVKGKVVQITPFGAFVDIGAAANALLHISKIRTGFVADVNDVLSLGQEIEGRIMHVDNEKRQITLSAMEDNAIRSARDDQKARTQRYMSKLKGAGWDPTQFVNGTVVGIMKFGAFVRFEASSLNSNCTGQLDCLAHISQLSPDRIYNAQDVVNVGDKVQVRLLSLDETLGQGVLTMLTEEEVQAKSNSDSNPQNSFEEDYLGEPGQDVSGLLEMGWDPNQFVEGTVTGTRNGGVDIVVENKELNSECTGLIVGFVRKSAIPKKKGQGVLHIGENVQVRLHEINDTRVRLSLLTPELMHKEQHEHDAKMAKRNEGRQRFSHWQEDLAKFNELQSDMPEEVFVVDKRQVAAQQHSEP